MKKIINVFILVFSLSFSFVSCDDPFADEDFAAYTEEPMGIYLETVPAYSSWVQLLKKADLYNALNVFNQFTCFVVNNEGVARYMKENNFSSIDSISKGEAKSILEFHIVPEMSLAYGALGGQISNKTASGDYLLVEYNDTIQNAPKFLNKIEIIRGGEQNVINGTIHELVDVLNPPLYTIGDLLERSDRYKLFTEALKLCGLDAYVNLKSTYVDDVEIRDYKTVLAVSDAVFSENGILDIAALRARFLGDPKDSRSDFNMFVAYHILPRSYDYTALITKEATSEGKNFETYAKNQFITVTDELLNYYINEHSAEGKIQMIPEYRNIMGNNGYIHDIDKLMEVVKPVGYDMEHEYTTGKEFEALEFYRGNNTKKWHQFDKDADFEFITVKTIPAGKGLLTYDNKVTWNMPWTYDDCLVVELGQIGSIDFEIPSIIPGRYEVIVYKWQYWHGVDHAVDRSKPGSVQTYFDGSRLGAVMSHGGNPHAFSLGEIYISELKEHVMTFKLTKPGPLAFDRVLFKAIN